MTHEDFAAEPEGIGDAEVPVGEPFSVRPRTPEGSLGKPPELRALGDLLKDHDPVPHTVAGAAYSAVHRRWQRPRQELSLVADELRTSSVRSEEPARVLTFRVSARILEMDLRATAPGWYAASGMVLTTDGGVVSDGDVLLRHAHGDSAVSLDEFGVFGVADVPRGPLSVVFRSSYEAPAVADWMVC